MKTTFPALGLPADEVIKDMKEGGFGFHAVWQNLEPFLRG